jgi:hypothetical protein
VLLPVIARYRGLDLPKFFRGGAAFAGPKLLRLLEQEGFRYAIRTKANAVLEQKIAGWLKRPVGRPSRKPKVYYCNLRDRSGSWGPGTPGSGQDRVARGRVVPPRRLPRHQPQVASEEGRALFQPPGYGGAMDKRGQACGEVDEVSLAR